MVFYFVILSKKALVLKKLMIVIDPAAGISLVVISLLIVRVKAEVIFGNVVRFSDLGPYLRTFGERLS